MPLTPESCSIFMVSRDTRESPRVQLSPSEPLATSGSLAPAFISVRRAQDTKPCHCSGSMPVLDACPTPCSAWGPGSQAGTLSLSPPCPSLSLPLLYFRGAAVLHPLQTVHLRFPAYLGLTQFFNLLSSGGRLFALDYI